MRRTPDSDSIHPVPDDAVPRPLSSPSREDDVCSGPLRECSHPLFDPRFAPADRGGPVFFRLLSLLPPSRRVHLDDSPAPADGFPPFLLVFGEAAGAGSFSRGERPCPEAPVPEEHDDEEWQDLLASLGARYPERFDESAEEAEVVEFLKAKVRRLAEPRKGEGPEGEAP